LKILVLVVRFRPGPPRNTKTTFGWFFHLVFRNSWGMVMLDDEQNIFKLGLWWLVGWIAHSALNAAAHYRLANPTETFLFNLAYLYASPV